MNDLKITKLEARVAKRFANSANNLQTIKEKIASAISLGADKIVSALLCENKILICGSDSSNLLAQYTASKFIYSFETARPVLPALALNNQLGSNNRMEESDEIFSRQIQALGQENDLLLIFLSQELNNNIIHAIKTAHQQLMQVIIICGETIEEINDYLNNDDLIIVTTLTQSSQNMELQLQSIHCLCDLVDHLLFQTP